MTHAINEEFLKIYEHLDDYALDLLKAVDYILHESIKEGLNEKVWSKMPMYYINERSIILALFKDHINIVSNPAIYKNDPVRENAITFYKEELKDYKITPKGMLQIYTNQEIPEVLLTKIFKKNFHD